MTDKNNKDYAALITKRNTLLLWEKLINLVLTVLTFILSTPFANNLWQKFLNSKSDQANSTIPKESIFVLNGYNSYIVDNSTHKSVGSITNFVSDKGSAMMILGISLGILIGGIIASSIYFNKRITEIEIELHDF
ncbi:hypothetical protein LOX61_01605 [Latilactobacillus curvatus]|uniref:hypothetical protein n=1 Tax=Latilactobacillus curvatus TaxID=28038 RepID=UPI0020C760CF|nr:hypothetical protein [Latilactobacillus curvatus]MCP8849199.1 hypothetical protein [Latilactobacillus curvatus]